MTRLSRRTTIAYSMGQLGSGLYGAFNNFTLSLYLHQFTSNAILIGWLSQTRSFEQSIIQPIVGARSDRTWTRFGRRAPFFLATMPIVALLLIVNGVLPRDPSFLWLAALTIFAFSLLYNIGIDPYYALLLDVTPAEHRGKVNGIAQIFGFVGYIALLLVAALLWEAHSEWVFGFVAVGLLLGFLVVAFGVHEPRDLGHAPSQPQDAVRRPHRSPRKFAADGMQYLRDLWHTEREAMKLMGAKLLYEFGINAAMPFLTLFMVEQIGVKGWPELIGAAPPLVAMGVDRMDAQGVSQLVAAFLVLMTLLSAVPSGWLGDRLGKKPVFAAGLLIVGVSALFAAFATTIPQLMFYLIFLGLGNGARVVLYTPYLGDLIPAARVGEFTGLSASAETAGVFLAALIAGELINMNVFDLGYRTIFVLTGIFLLLGFVAVLFVKARLALPPVPAEVVAAPVVADAL